MQAVHDRPASQGNVASPDTLSETPWPGRGMLPVAALLFVLTFLARLPSFFEPAWNTDEGIFEAVAQRVAEGGTLYADAWESKPPVFLYFYVAITELFGPGILPLRIATALSAFGAALALFIFARHLMPPKRAIFAASAFAVLTATPFWEGNLALTEAFVALPTVLGMLCVSTSQRSASPERYLLAAGVFFGLAFLIRQPMALLAAGCLLWLFVSSRPWLKPAVLIAAGSAAVILPVVAGFWLLGSFHWFWDANVAFFFSYVSSGRELPLHYRPLIVLPVVVTFVVLLAVRRNGAPPAWSLPSIWLTITLAAALLTGRPYSHYFLPVIPPLCLALALLPLPRLARPRLSMQQAPAPAIALSVALLWLLVVRPEFGGNLLAMHHTRGPEYYANFAERAVGVRSAEEYNNFFDRRVELTYDVVESLEKLGATDKKVYLWGEYPWVYSLARTEPATRYMTSFYVLLIPYLDVNLKADLLAEEPEFIVVFDDAMPGASDPDGIMRQRYRNATNGIAEVLSARYRLVEDIAKAHIYQRKPDAASQ